VKPRHAAALALVGWYLIAPVFGLAANAKPKLSTYTNDAYGISFRYRSDLALKPGDSELSWGYLGAVENAMPHGTMLAAVVLPYQPDIPGNYPLFLRVSVDTILSEKDCDDPTGKRVKVGAIQFNKTEDGDMGMCHQRFANYYRVLKNQACYEFEIGEVTHCEMTKDEEHMHSAGLKELRRVLATVTIRPTKLKSSH
jgi:hypothetical protein